MYIKIGFLLLIFLVFLSTAMYFGFSPSKSLAPAGVMTGVVNKTTLSRDNRLIGTLSGTEAETFAIYGYYPYWSHTQFPPVNLPTTHIDGYLHAFVWPSGSGSLVTPPGFLDSPFAQVAREKGKSTSISVGGWQHSDGFKNIANDPKLRDTFIDELAEFVKKNGYNQINIDWEYPSGTAQSNALALLADNIRFKIPNIILTVALPISLSTQDIEIELIERSFDYIFVMSYDLETGSQGYAGYNAPLYKNTRMPLDMSIATLLEKEYINRGVPRKKIILGIPLYGLKFMAEKPYTQVTTSVSVEYKDLPSENCDRNYDTESQVPYLSCNGYYISYDDQESIAEKMLFAKANGLGGVYFWALGQDNNKLMDQLIPPK